MAVVYPTMKTEGGGRRPVVGFLVGVCLFVCSFVLTLG